MDSMVDGVQHSSPVLVLARSGNASISLVRGLLDQTDMRRIGDHYRAVADAHGSVCGVAVLCEGTQVAGREALGEARRFTIELADRLSTIAVVVEAHGVAAQMLSSVVRGINTLIRHKRLVICKDMHEAASTMSPHLVLKSAQDLERAVERARQAWPADP